MPREDLAWEALVEATRANPVFERGRIAVALKAIRECCQMDGISEEGIPDEIRSRAAHYRDHFKGIELTPTALARHWYRVLPRRSDDDILRERGYI
jgi:hypothetical protein